MKSNKTLGLLGLFVIMMGITAPTYSQKAWEKKPYDQWSRSEVFTILMDSPWAQVRDEKFDSTEYSSVIRLRSALPIRQALVRQKQIFLNYHKFTAADKARFDSEVKEFLECPDCAKYYIVTLNTHAIRPLINLSLDDLKAYIYLANDKGERRQLVHFIPPKTEDAAAMFVFQRFDDQGKPLITKDNKSFFFKIEDKLLERKTVPLKRFTFEVSRMIQNGVIVF